MVRKRPLPDDFDELDEEEQKLIRKKFRKLCRAHPAYRKHTERWTHLSSMYPMYKTRHPGVFDLRLRQAAVHLAIAEKVSNRRSRMV